MKGRLRLAAEAIHARLANPSVGMSYGRRSYGQHVKPPFIKFVPIGGPIGRARRTAGKTVPGTAGMIEGGPTASLAQPNVDKRLVEAATRETRMLAVLIGSSGKDEPDGIDVAENLLERFIVAAKDEYGQEVTLSERWIIQDEERAGWGVAGEAVVVTMDFIFPVIREERPLIRVGGFAQTCKLDDTLEDDHPPPP